MGLVYFGKRYLNTSLQRWVSADPLTVHSGGADPNLYAYVSGQALKNIDPVGLDQRQPDSSQIQARSEEYREGQGVGRAYAKAAIAYERGTQGADLQREQRLRQVGHAYAKAGDSAKKDAAIAAVEQEHADKIQGLKDAYWNAVADLKLPTEEPLSSDAELFAKGFSAGVAEEAQRDAFSRSVGEMILTSVATGGISAAFRMANMAVRLARGFKAGADAFRDVMQASMGGVPVGPAKRGPKPFGTGPHNLKIKEVADNVTDGTVIAGGQRPGLPERLIETPGGYKSGRRPDVLVQREDGSVYGVNVGKQTKSGQPVKREREAMSDLEGAGVPMQFVPYN